MVNNTSCHRVILTRLGLHYSFNNSTSVHPRASGFGRGTVEVYLKKSMNRFFQVCVRQASSLMLKDTGERFNTFLYRY